MLDSLAKRKDPKSMRDRAILRCLYDLGLRRAEVLRLDLEDLDMEGGTVAVLGKGNMLSDRLEQRFLQRLRRDGTVDWTPEIRIGLRGLDLADRKGVREYVEWQRISKMEVDQGMFRLWVHTDVNPLLQTSTSQPNFFPAYSLAMRLWKRTAITSPPRR